MIVTDPTSKHLSPAVRTLIRDCGNLPREDKCAIKLIEGDSSPALSGGPAWYETKGGTKVDHPNAWIRKGGRYTNLIRHDNTRCVLVGRDWLLAVLSFYVSRR